jgi:polysaccharide chain length determinant protein (PEP-CTERM system associated)
MRIDVEELVDQVRGAWRFWRLAVAVAWSVALLGWLGVLAWPDSYEASARVFVKTSTPLRPLLEGLAVEQDVDSDLNLVRENLLGRPRLERVAREADLDVTARTPTEHEQAITNLENHLLIDAQAPRSVQRENRRSTDAVYTITYHNPRRDRALTVVRSLLNSLVEDTMSGKRSGADSAEKFLTDQIATYEKRLSAAESQLAEFKKRNVGLVPGEQGDYFARLQSEIIAVKKAQDNLDVALRRRSELERQLRELPLGGAAATAAPPGAGRARSTEALAGADTASRIAETEAKLADLLLRYTDRHPDVIALRQTLAELKVRQQAELEGARKGDPSALIASGLSSNPVYQSIQLQVNQTDVEVATLRGELADHMRTESELRRVANTATEVEAEFARLTRDYTVEKAQYTALVERLQKARLSEDAASTGIVQFQVINPPQADLQPVAPKRPLLLIVVLIVALLAGGAAAWLMAQLRPVFASTRLLRDLTGLAVLGSVSRTWAERYRLELRGSVRRFAAAMGALALVFIAVLVLQHTGSQMLQKLFVA